MSQIVNFTSPSVIATLQNQVGTNPPTIPNVSQMTRYINFITTGTSGIYCAKGTGQPTNSTGAATANTDLNGQAFKGYTAVVGNVFSDNQSYFTTGARDALGNVVDLNSAFNQGSSTKLLADRTS